MRSGSHPRGRTGRGSRVLPRGRLDHYFITAEPKEINDLDTGVHTGLDPHRLPLLRHQGAAARTPARSPMCRFYSPTLDTHFYSAKKSECEDVKDKFADTLDLRVRRSVPRVPVDPATGVCAADTTPTYRLYNNRPDANHRYTDQIARVRVHEVQELHSRRRRQLPRSRSCSARPRAAIVVPARPNPRRTARSPRASGTPAIGSTLTLNASCTNNPTSYMWVGLHEHAAPAATRRRRRPARRATRCYAANAQGPGTRSRSPSTWGSGGAAAAVAAAAPCRSARSRASTIAPVHGSPLTLTANCNQTRRRATSGRSATTSSSRSVTSSRRARRRRKTCTVNSTMPGYARYAVDGKNSAGTGPRSPLDVYWGASSSGGGGGGGGRRLRQAAARPIRFPRARPSRATSNPQIGTNIVLSASCSGNPDLVLVARRRRARSVPVPGNVEHAGHRHLLGHRRATRPVRAVAYVARELGHGTVPNPVPSCSLSASNGSPQVGTSVTITASCTNNPTTLHVDRLHLDDVVVHGRRLGRGCQDVLARRPPTPTATARRRASRSTGQPGDVAAGVHGLAPAIRQPTVGQNITLTASCTNGPTSYEWTGCTSTGATCTTTASATGAVTYDVAGINQFGKGSAAGVVVAWTAAGGGGGRRRWRQLLRPVLRT